MKLDLISLGEPLLRLSPPGHEQLRRARGFEAVVAGSQLNVAANLCRLGMRAAFATKLPENPLGLLALDAFRGYGLDTSFVKFEPRSRMGITYVEFSAMPRPPKAIYDRARSAASLIGPEDFDWDSLASQARFLYTDGIFPGLSAPCREASLAFLQAARKHGCTTCFDINYRDHIWTPEAAQEVFREILPLIDILVTNRMVSETVFHFEGTDSQLLHRYAKEFGCPVVCLTHREMQGLRMGTWKSKVLADGAILDGKARAFEIVDRYGTGDAWFAGFLYGYMTRDTAFGVDFGNTLCALAHTIEGDVIHLTAQEVIEALDENAELGPKR